MFIAAEELTMGGMKFKIFDLGGHKQGKCHNLKYVFVSGQKMRL
jgi:hypothetical protein